MLKKVSAKKAYEINKRNGMETEEDDNRKTYWLSNEDETETYGPFYSIKERDRFLEK